MLALCSEARRSITGRRRWRTRPFSKVVYASKIPVNRKRTGGSRELHAWHVVRRGNAGERHREAGSLPVARAKYNHAHTRHFLTADPRFAPWSDYYVIIGSAAAALIGIQFVVITLIASFRTKPQPETVDAFATPSVLHLTGALLVSAMMTAPWSTLRGPSLILGAYGVFGIVYGVIVIRRARRQSGYRPVFEDWLWHSIFPIATSLALTVSAFLLWVDAPHTLFLVAGAAFGLLSIGIHNAWDSVTHLVITEGKKTKEAD